MSFPLARRFTGYACALLQLILVVGAPLADAAIDRRLGTQLSVEQTDQRGQQASLHDESNCVFCAAVRTVAELPANVEVGRIVVAVPLPAAALDQSAAPQLFLSVAHSRAPPAIA